MNKISLTDIEKIAISKHIKMITLDNAVEDFNKLRLISNNFAKKTCNISPRCRTGNNIVDYFTFTERLNTKGKYDVNFFEFLVNIEEFKKKKFISNMLKYYEDVKNKNKTKNNYIVLKEVYNICVSAINIFRPLVAIEIYTKYNPTSVLDFTCGWGGRLVGACALNIPNYIGIDINTNLINPYLEMKSFFKNISETNIDIFFENAANFDYSKITYDMVLTSPPYYFLEKYSNNENYNNSKTEMKNNFYIPVISNTYKYLQQGGHYCLNINKEIYEDICVGLLGPANDMIPLKKSKRQNDYEEFIYVWYKN
jgi:tRNA1(Val) A37 N6-methylase TrmN6